MDRDRVRILLVEDNDPDVRLFQTLLHGRFQVTVSKTGAEALDTLFQRGSFAGTPLPDVVVLDLNVPILNGHEILSVIKSNPALRSLPVVVYSGAEHASEVRKAYELGACAYIVKRSDLGAMDAALKAFAEFWINQVVYPRPRSLQATAETGETGEHRG